MKKTKILSSTFVMTMVSFCAFGADTKITEASTCTVDVLGVSDNKATANAIATWSLNEYTLDPGEYLKVTDTSVTETTCPAGSYCVGGGYTVETADNSIAQCPTTHPNSATGAGADTQCYTACTVANANIAHATAVSGNDYFGAGADTCGATACETGYHVDGGGIELVEKTPLVPISLTDTGDGFRFVSADGTSHSEGTVDAIPADSVTAPNTWATAYGEGVVYGKASCQPQIRDAGMEYLMTNMSSVLDGDMTIEEFESGMLPLAGKGKTDYAVKILTGVMDGSVSEEEMSKALFVVFGSEYDANYSTISTGQYCYCQMDGFMPTGGTKDIVTSAPWVHLGDMADSCTSSCAGLCAILVQSNIEEHRVYQVAVYGALGYTETGGICAANTINIDWNPDNNGAHTINQCTYEGSITVPSDPVKPGYTFTGWKLVE